MKNLLAILFVLMAVIPVKAEDGGESDTTALPPAVSLSYIYLDSDSESGSDNSSDGTRVRLFFSDTEGVDYIVLEMLKAGSILPNKALISDMSKGYFDTTIWHNTTFTAVAYNDYGHTRGIPLFVPVKPTADVVEVEEPDLEVARMLIYNLDGSIVFDGSPAAFSIDNLSSGLYIKKEILSDGDINTAKIIVR